MAKPEAVECEVFEPMLDGCGDAHVRTVVRLADGQEMRQTLVITSGAAKTMTHDEMKSRAREVVTHPEALEFWLSFPGS